VGRGGKEWVSVGWVD